MKKEIKRYGLLALVGVLLVGAIYVNVRLNNKEKNNGQGTQVGDASNGDSVQTSVTGTDFFSSFRKDRDSVRNNELQYLNEIIGAANTDQETLKDAQQQKLDIVDAMEKELVVENLVKAKGFQDVAVTFHKGSVNVIVDTAELTTEQVAQILEIVQRETGEDAQNITVSTQQ